MHPILCRWPGGGTLSTYSVFFVLSYLVGIVWLRTQLKHLQSSPGLFWSLIAALFVAALAGGKFGFYVVEWRGFRAEPWTMLSDWKTGWVFWPGFLLAMFAGVLYQLWYNRAHRPRAYLPVADYFAAALALGHVPGRIGCFMEGCCHGLPTDLPWGAAFTNIAVNMDETFLGVPLHPTQLYEAFGEAIAAALLIGFILPKIRAGGFRYGTAFLGYILYYSVLRFFIEFLRGDDRGVFLWPALSPSQWVSAAAGLSAAWTLKVRGVVEPCPKKRTIYSDGRP